MMVHLRIEMFDFDEELEHSQWVHKVNQIRWKWEIYDIWQQIEGPVETSSEALRGTTFASQTSFAVSIVFTIKIDD